MFGIVFGMRKHFMYDNNTSVILSRRIISCIKKHPSFARIYRHFLILFCTCTYNAYFEYLFNIFVYLDWVKAIQVLLYTVKKVAKIKALRTC